MTRRDIANRLHHVRHVTIAEDRGTARSRAAPVRTACPNQVIAPVRRAGAANIAVACRTSAGRSRSAIARIASAGCQVMT